VGGEFVCPAHYWTEAHVFLPVPLRDRQGVGVQVRPGCLLLGRLVVMGGRFALPWAACCWVIRLWCHEHNHWRLVWSSRCTWWASLPASVQRVPSRVISSHLPSALSRHCLRSLSHPLGSGAVLHDCSVIGCLVMLPVVTVVL
jgi:hypothetical protein